MLVISKKLGNIFEYFFGEDQCRYILEVEGRICSLDPEFSASGNLRKVIHRLNREYKSGIYKMDCNCDYKQKAKLNLDGTPRKHSVYLKDWAI